MLAVANLLLSSRHLLAVGYGWVAIVLILCGGELSPRLRRTTGFLFVAVSIICLVALRGPSFFLNYPLNPDEAEFLASAMKFRTNINSWASVDMTSSGPFNAYPLMWPYLFGREVSFFSARVTAALVISASWLLAWSAVRSSPLPVRVFAFSALTLFLGTASDPNFLHFSSELVPVLLIMVAFRATLLTFERPVGRSTAALAALCLGLVPFAKPQAVVVAAPLGLILLWRMARQSSRPWPVVFLLAAFAVLPALAILLPLGPSGIRDFWISAIGFAMNYVKTDDVLMTGLPPWQLRHPGLAALFGYQLALLFFVTVAAVPIGGWVLLAGNRLFRRVTITTKGPTRGAVLVAAVIAASGVVAVFAPRRPFQHYAVMAIWPLAVVCCLEAGRLYGRLTGAGRVAMGALATIPSFLLLAATLLEVPSNPGFEAFAPERLLTSSNMLASVRPAKGRLFIWGWMPQWYVWSGWTPATRDILNQNQIVPTADRAYFRSRLMAELRAAPPEYVIDATGPGDFRFVDAEKFGIATFPDLQAFVSDRYQQLNEDMAGQCPRVFARKDFAEELRAKMIGGLSVSSTQAPTPDWERGSPWHVADGNILEDCSDAWFPPPPGESEVFLDLKTPQDLGEIELLNTRGDATKPRVTTQAVITGYHGRDVVFRRAVKMRRFPFVTTLEVPPEAGAVDRVGAKIVAFAGAGGGLAEIRVRRR